MSNGTGNLADLINNVFEKNSKAINILSSLVGAVADAGGAASAVLAVVNLFTSQSNPLQPILDEIKKDFAELFAYLEAWQKDQDWRNLATLVKDAEAVVDELDGFVHAQPPLTDFQRLGLITTCLAPLEALSDETIRPTTGPFFVTPYNVQVYWTDAGLFFQEVYSYDKQIGWWVESDKVDPGYGAQAPPAPTDNDNQVFFYLYVLPYYLKAVFMLTAVGCALYSDFGKSAQRQDEHNALIRFAKFLAKLHDLIVGGITKLSPAPPPWVQEPLRPTSPINEIGGFVRGIVGTFKVVPPNPRKHVASTVELINIMPIWGAVEKFSGFSSTKWFGVLEHFSVGRIPEKGPLTSHLHQILVF